MTPHPTSGLFTFDHTEARPQQLFDDLELGKLFSARAIAVLQRPCSTQEILRRQELFAQLDRADKHRRISDCVTQLTEVERLLNCLSRAELPLARYHLLPAVIDAYVEACGSLASLADCGELLARAAGIFSSPHIQVQTARLCGTAEALRLLLGRMQISLLSFSDKNWIIPDSGAISDTDQIAACARQLGFVCPERKPLQISPDRVLSDTLCRLYAEETEAIASHFASCADVDFSAPLAYLPDLKFCLEIFDLVQRAARAAIPHCLPRIAEKPQYTAKALYDISLMARGCTHIIPNDADFTDSEPFLFLTGANSGGKTTYLRALGINLLLFLAGCPVFAQEASIYPFDTVAAHFPKDERFDHVGRLDEELHRTNEMLGAAKGKTAFLLFNETFSGTDDKRGFSLLRDTAEQVRAAAHFGLCVTHFHEVMTLEFPVLSAEIDPKDENRRTYRIVKAKGTVSAYAADILKRYKLDSDSLQARRANRGN